MQGCGFPDGECVFPEALHGLPARRSRSTTSDGVRTSHRECKLHHRAGCAFKVALCTFTKDDQLFTDIWSQGQHEHATEVSVSKRAKLTGLSMAEKKVADKRYVCRVILLSPCVPGRDVVNHYVSRI